jgi:hypothetical protein
VIFKVFDSVTYRLSLFSRLLFDRAQNIEPVIKFDFEANLGSEKSYVYKIYFTENKIDILPLNQLFFLKSYIFSYQNIRIRLEVLTSKLYKILAETRAYCTALLIT